MDHFSSLYTLYMWSSAELAVSIIFPCLLSLLPTFRKIREKRHSRYSAGSQISDSARAKLSRATSGAPTALSQRTKARMDDDSLKGMELERIDATNRKVRGLAHPIETPDQVETPHQVPEDEITQIPLMATDPC